MAVSNPYILELKSYTDSTSKNILIIVFYKDTFIANNMFQIDVSEDELSVHNIKLMSGILEAIVLLWNSVSVELDKVNMQHYIERFCYLILKITVQ